jgi:hypothetical protein
MVNMDFYILDWEKKLIISKNKTGKQLIIVKN